MGRIKRRSIRWSSCERGPPHPLRAGRPRLLKIQVKFLTKFLFYISLNLSSKKISTRMSGRLFCLWFVFTWAVLQSVIPTFEGRFSSRGCREGRMVIIGISKDGEGCALTCGSLPRSRCCDVYRRGCIPLFPSSALWTL